MKWICFKTENTRYAPGAPHFGVLLDEGAQIFDFSAHLFAESNIKPNDSLEWFDVEGELFHRAKSLFGEITGAKELLTRFADYLLRREDVNLLAPVPRPGKLICIGLNYRDHAVESNLPIPEKPLIFSKFSTSVAASGDAIVLPPGSMQVDYEAELAVVVGRRAKLVSAAEALEFVFGYMNFNDVSARDFQFADNQWQRGKSCDTFAPCGEYILTTDELPDPHNLSIKLRLNGETMQNSNTNQLIFTIPEIIAFISQSITLEPGDIIATGTPPGVGFAKKPPIFLQDGDCVEVEIERLGTLRNFVKK